MEEYDAIIQSHKMIVRELQSICLRYVPFGVNAMMLGSKADGFPKRANHHFIQKLLTPMM